jgi:hypothetical protein
MVVRFKRLGSEEWCDGPSSFSLDDPKGEEMARAQLKELRRLWYAHQQAAGGDGSLTVERWAKSWNKKRREAGIDCVPEDEQRFGITSSPPSATCSSPTFADSMFASCSTSSRRSR